MHPSGSLLNEAATAEYSCRVASSDATKINRIKGIWLVLVCIDSTVPIMIIWKYRQGDVSSSVAVITGIIVLAGGNLAALFGFQRRSGHDGGPLKKRLVAGAAALAIVSFLLTVLGVSVVKHRNGYMELATSDAPLSSIEPERKRLVVELIRRTAEISQEENKTIAEAQKAPMNPAVYSPESFKDEKTIQSTVAQLADYSQIDFKYFAQQQAAREDFRRKMTACDSEYLERWDADRRDQEGMERSANQLEHDWFASVKSLYDYAQEHAREIGLKDGKVSISDNTVRTTFDGLLDRSKALNEKLQSTVREEVRLQQQAKAKIAE